MPVQPLIMPKLGAYTEDILLVEWLVAEGARSRPARASSSSRPTRRRPRWRPTQAATCTGSSRRGEGADRRRRRARRRHARGVRGPASPRPKERGSPSRPMATARVDAGRRLPRRGGATRAAAPRVAAGACPARCGSATRSRTPPRSRAPGPGGRIVDRDVSAWAEARPRPGGVDAATAPAAPAVASTIPLRGRRGTIARRMVASLQTAAQLTSVLELDVKPLVELRSQLNDAGASPRIGITSIVVKLAAAALREHPLLNSRVTETEVELLADINVAVAIDTPDGLVAPVVHGADRRSLEEVNARITELARRARDLRAPARRRRRRHLHGLERRHPSRRHHDRDPQPAAVRRSSGSAVSATGRWSSPTARSPSGRRSRPASPSTIAPIDGGARRRVPRHARVARRRPAPAPGMSAGPAAADRRRSLHRTMLTIRLFEQRVAREFRTGEIPGFVHVYVGEEAVAAGVCAHSTTTTTSRAPTAATGTASPRAATSAR